MPSPAALRFPALLLLLWLALFAATAATPSLLDDADATHAGAALHMAQSGDLVTLRVNGLRYLEKPPLPYWLVAAFDRLLCLHEGSFHPALAAFAAHLPAALAVLLLALLGYHWAGSAFGERAALYTALGVLTSAGVFLFTRIFIPEALLSLFFAAALYCFLEGFDRARPAWFYAAAAFIAFATLTKGLFAPLFFLATIFVFLLLTAELRRWRELRLVRCTLVYLAIAAPWHILAALRNRGGLNNRGFLWFYFVNEHVLRFLGRRYPMDYNKLPAALYWLLHVVWLFPWSLFLPLAVVAAWRWFRAAGPSPLHNASYAARTTLLLAIFSAIALIFFSLSTNQEYYTFPVYLPLLMFTAAALARTEASPADKCAEHRWLTTAHAALAVLSAAASITLFYGLWASRHSPYVSDIGDLLAHRGVGNYTLSMSHFFDLTTGSFAALRLPAAIAAIAFAIGPAAAWRLRARSRHSDATLTIALTSAIFLFAAHIALVRFQPMLGSRAIAEDINAAIALSPTDADAQVLLFGDFSYGSSIAFYTQRQVSLVDGRTSSLIWGSTYADAPHIFLAQSDLLARWGHGPRIFLFVPLEQSDAFDDLIAAHPDLRFILLDEMSGKSLYTDLPLAPVSQ
jgi:4-amino-4-deoxy-L-arabinose transferase-like glycosyltransferase